MNDPQAQPTAPALTDADIAWVKTQRAEPALGISVQCAAGDAQIVFQTHVAQDVDAASINALLDRLTKAAARQKAKAELPALEKRLKVETKQLERLREDRTRIEASLATPQKGRRNPQRNEVQLKHQREQADATEKRFMEIIAEITETITATQALIAGG